MILKCWILVYDPVVTWGCCPVQVATIYAKQKLKKAQRGKAPQKVQ